MTKLSKALLMHRNLASRSGGLWTSGSLVGDSNLELTNSTEKSVSFKSFFTNSSRFGAKALWRVFEGIYDFRN